MTKKNKLKTPEWILEGYGSEEEYNNKNGIKTKKKSGKTFKIRKCPECGSDEVGIVLTGEEGHGKSDWECRKCKWTGKNIDERELNEEELMKYLDEKGEKIE